MIEPTKQIKDLKYQLKKYTQENHEFSQSFYNIPELRASDSFKNRVFFFLMR